MLTNVIYTRNRMANSTLKCQIIILITARSFNSYDKILINFGQLYSNNVYNFQYCNFGHVYSMWISSTLDSEALYLSHISAPHKMTYFLPNWPCRYGMCIYIYAHIDPFENNDLVKARRKKLSLQPCGQHKKQGEVFQSFGTLNPPFL